LTRSVAFLSKLLAADVEIRFVDMPTIEGATGRFPLQQMASVAELEAGMIGERTRKALAAGRPPTHALHWQALPGESAARRSGRYAAQSVAWQLPRTVVFREAAAMPQRPRPKGSLMVP
jgi:DNA invertase Pin-like site-specific DNA recombinase